MKIELLILFAGVLLSLGCIILVLQGSGKRRTRIGKRAETLCRRIAAKNPALPVSGGSVKREGYGKRSFLDRFARRFLPRPEVLEQRLSRTGSNIRVGRYLALNLILIVLFILIFSVVFSFPLFLSIATSVFAGIAVPHFMVGRMARKRIDKFTALFPDAIDLIVRGLRSGLPVTESISAVGHEMADPVGGEFRRISESMKLGLTLEDALWDTARRLDTPDFKFFIISLSVQRETGGNLAETLANLSDILRRRRQMRLKIKAMSSEARASAYILGSLPFVVFAVIYVMNQGYAMDLFTDPRGRIMLGFGLVMMTIGIGIMSKMVKFKI